LSEMVYHYKSFLNFKHLPNIHFFHFSELKRDLLGQMQRLAGVLNIEIDADLLEQLVIAAGFESMKDKASQYVPASGMQVWKSETKFFNRGDAYHRSELKQKDLEIYDKAISQLIGRKDIEWLEHGPTITK
jgi:aryl sulfotransferase